MSNLYSALPSVDVCMQFCSTDAELAEAPRALIRQLVHAFLQKERETIRNGKIENADQLVPDLLMPALLSFIKKGVLPHFRRIINATGVIIHTNLGRAVLAEEALAAVSDACAGYSNLELDLQTGKRGNRYSHVESLLCQLTGAEAAIAVNNNAAAVLLVLNTLCAGGEVILARGQMVEIGGSFRIPDVMQRSGAILHEIGCTNRVHLEDYSNAINEKTRALLRVHTSNYRIIGFYNALSVHELAVIAKKHNLPLLEDLGSGVLIDLAQYGLLGEPTVQASIKAGADVVTFSGDKALGGPQAGLICGKKEYLDAIRKNPLNRALRPGKMTLAALEATLRLYLDEKVALKQIPVLRMLTFSAAELAERASHLQQAIQSRCRNLSVELVAGESRVGGGAFPERPLPTTLVRINLACAPEILRDYLLHSNPPVLGRIDQDAFHLDTRTLDEKEFAIITEILANFCTHSGII